MKRPGIITAFCVFGFIAVVLLIIALVFLFANPGSGIYPNWYVIYLGVMIPILLAIFIGLWKMKRWSVILLTISNVLGWIISLTIFRITSLNAASIPGLLFSIGLLVFLWRNYSKMN